MSTAARDSSEAPDSGMTLVELMVVLAILGLAATLAVPGFRGPGRTVELRTTAHDLASNLRSARAEAISRSAPVTVAFDVAGRRYRIGGADRSVQMPGDVAIRLDTAAALVRDGGDARVVFYPDGSSSGGRVALVRGTAQAAVGIDWLTGHVAIEVAP